MNIVTKTFGGRIIVRPDTTWEKDNEDFYPPEFVDSLTFSPVIFMKILKPGRSVRKEFARRYYDAVNFGVLLYPENIIDGQEGFAEASCLDHTSFLPFPMASPDSLPKGGQLTLCKNGLRIFTQDVPSMSSLESAIEDATRFVYIRTGDLLAIELDARRPLASRTEGTSRVTGSGGSGDIDFRIIF